MVFFYSHRASKFRYDDTTTKYLYRWVREERSSGCIGYIPIKGDISVSLFFYPAETGDTIIREQIQRHKIQDGDK